MDLWVWIFYGPVSLWTWFGCGEWWCNWVLGGFDN